jgi:hypothetical protein
MFNASGIISLLFFRRLRRLRLPGSPRAGTRERLTVLCMPRSAAGQPLPTFDTDVDKAGIELDQPGAPAGPFRLSMANSQILA